MAEIKTIPLEKIFVPERLREVEEDHAFVISQSVARIGLLNPITVRSTPRAAKPYTLVAGAHRLRAVELTGEAEIEAAIVQADQTEGQMIEIEENVFRNELSALDRAVFVRRYRELYEEVHGKIVRGNPQLSNSANFAELVGDSAQGHFYQRVADRMGLSRRAVEYAQFVGSKLTPDLRQRLRGTQMADNQSALIRLAKMEPAKQQQMAQALEVETDLKKATVLVEGVKPKRSAQEQVLDRLVATWAQADETTRQRFLELIGAVRGLS